MLYPISERTKRLREEYLQSPMFQDCVPPFTYGNHPTTVYWLEAYYQARNAHTTLERRSIAQVAELDRSRVFISENDLIVGKPDFFMDQESREKANELHEMFKMAYVFPQDDRSDHTALDYRKLLKVGVSGLIDEIRSKKQMLSFSGESIREDTEKEEFYDACLMELMALVRYARRYENALREMAESAGADRRAELLTMADNMLQVPEKPAETFWQALQSIHFFTFTLRGLYSAGRPDQDLIEYYKADVEKGILTPEFAQELIDNYCLTFASYVSRYTTTGLMVGGTDENGHPVENELTWMFLNASEHIKMSDPNTGLCISRNTSDDLINHALGMIGRGCAFPAFWNDDEIVASLQRAGFHERDSHRYINSTCVELTIIGKSAMWTTCPYHNLAGILLEVFEKSRFDSYEELEDLFFNKIDEEIQQKNKEINKLKLERSRNPTEPMLHSCLVDHCIERGKNIGQGGAVYNATLPNFLGFANAIDSLSAIRELVFDSKKYTIEEYRRAVSSNYEGYEILRQYIINRTLHYGNNEEKVDSIAIRITECILKSCRKAYTFDGDILIPGIFSYSYHVLYGSMTPATPDGRKAGEPLSDSAGPAQGRDTHSPTAAILSGTKWNQGNFTGGPAQNIRLSKRYFEKDGISILLTLLKTFLARGGIELQINCVDTAVLEDAMVNPEKHRDLVVRVGGYCDFYVMLDKKLQREIIERTNY